MLLEIARHQETASDFHVDWVEPQGEPTWNDRPTRHHVVSPLSGRPIDEMVTVRGPTVETSRLRLRPFTMEDYADYGAMLADPSNWTHMGIGPMRGEESWMRFLRHVGHWQMLGFGTFGVFDRETGQFVGEVGFSQHNRNLGGHFDWAPEASWMIAGEHKNTGLATEAVAAALTWMERALGATRTVCIINEQNLASRRVAEKIGYRAFKQSEFRGYSAIFYERIVIGL